MANMADVVIAVKDADFYITAPSEVKAEESFAQGTVDILADDVNGAIASVKNLVSLLPSNNLEAAPMFDFEEKLSYGADANASAKLSMQLLMKTVLLKLKQAMQKMRLLLLLRLQAQQQVLLHLTGKMFALHVHIRQKPSLSFAMPLIFRLLPLFMQRVLLRKKKIRCLLLQQS